MVNMSLPWLDAAVLSDLSESLSRTQRTSFRLDQSRKGIVSKEPRAQVVQAPYAFLSFLPTRLLSSTSSSTWLAYCCGTWCLS
jgi:hypothetical protein